MQLSCMDWNNYEMTAGAVTTTGFCTRYLKLLPAQHLLLVVHLTSTIQSVMQIKFFTIVSHEKSANEHWDKESKLASYSLQTLP